MTDRRLALDWLRIGAFALLILYHVGMFYVSWDWHVKSSRASEAIEPLMMFVNPWRLLLLFIISGCATRYMADKVKTGALIGSRSWRLLPPLIFAILVVVPPQTYFELIEHGWRGSWAEFYERYITASGHWCGPQGCLITPTYNHMWFVAYLFIYTLALAALLPLLRRLPARRFAWLVSGPALLIAPWLLLYAARALLFPIFGQTHALVDDWYLHTVFFGGFLFGFAIAKCDAFFAACAKQRRVALFLGLVCYAAGLAFFALAGEALADRLILIPRALREMQAWGMIVALIGYAHLYLRGDGPVRRYMTDAIFPFYLVHQTVIVVVGHYLDPLRLPLWIEASLLIGATLAACFASYEIAKRVAFLRPIFGLKAAAPQAKAVEAPASEGHIRSEA